MGIVGMMLVTLNRNINTISVLGRKSRAVKPIVLYSRAILISFLLLSVFQFVAGSSQEQVNTHTNSVESTPVDNPNIRSEMSCPKIKEMHTNREYLYKGVSTVTETYVKFRVKSLSDAHIALGPFAGQHEPHYEIVLGGWKNTASVIRYCNQGENIAHHKGKVLSSTTFSSFWISWDQDDDGYLRVGQGDIVGNQEIMKAKLTVEMPKWATEQSSNMCFGPDCTEVEIDDPFELPEDSFNRFAEFDPFDPFGDEFPFNFEKDEGKESLNHQGDESSNQQGDILQSTQSNAGSFNDETSTSFGSDAFSSEELSDVMKETLEEHKLVMHRHSIDYMSVSTGWGSSGTWEICVAPEKNRNCVGGCGAGTINLSVAKFIAKTDLLPLPFRSKDDPNKSFLTFWEAYEQCESIGLVPVEPPSSEVNMATVYRRGGNKPIWVGGYYTADLKDDSKVVQDGEINKIIVEALFPAYPVLKPVNNNDVAWNILKKIFQKRPTSTTMDNFRTIISTFVPPKGHSKNDVEYFDMLFDCIKMEKGKGFVHADCNTRLPVVCERPKRDFVESHDNDENERDKDVHDKDTKEDDESLCMLPGNKASSFDLCGVCGGDSSSCSLAATFMTKVYPDRTWGEEWFADMDCTKATNGPLQTVWARELADAMGVEVNRIPIKNIVLVGGTAEKLCKTAQANSKRRKLHTYFTFVDKVKNQLSQMYRRLVGGSQSESILVSSVVLPSSDSGSKSTADVYYELYDDGSAAFKSSGDGSVVVENVPFFAFTGVCGNCHCEVGETWKTCSSDCKEGNSSCVTGSSSGSSSGRDDSSSDKKGKGDDNLTVIISAISGVSVILIISFMFLVRRWKYGSQSMRDLPIIEAKRLVCLSHISTTRRASLTPKVQKTTLKSSKGWSSSLIRLIYTASGLENTTNETSEQTKSSSSNFETSSVGTAVTVDNSNHCTSLPVCSVFIGRYDDRKVAIFRYLSLNRFNARLAKLRHPCLSKIFGFTFLDGKHKRIEKLTQSEKTIASSFSSHSKSKSDLGGKDKEMNDSSTDKQKANKGSDVDAIKACEAKLTVVTEYLPVALTDFLSKDKPKENKVLMQDQLLAILQQVCAAVGAVHSLGLSHGHIHPDNIRFSNHWKTHLETQSKTSVDTTIDINLDSNVCNVNEKQKNDNFLMLHPKLCDYYFNPLNSNQKDDIYSIGVIIWSLYQKKHIPGAFKGCGNETEALAEAAKIRKNISEESFETPNLLYTLIADCIHCDLEKRPDISEIQRRLQDPNIMNKVGDKLENSTYL